MFSLLRLIRLSHSIVFLAVISIIEIDVSVCVALHLFKMFILAIIIII